MGKQKIKDLKITCMVDFLKKLKPKDLDNVICYLSWYCCDHNIGSNYLFPDEAIAMERIKMNPNQKWVSYEDISQKYKKRRRIVS